MVKTMQGAFGDDGSWEHEFLEIQLGLIAQDMAAYRTPDDLLDRTDAFLRRTAKILGEQVTPDITIDWIDSSRPNFN